ncbi:MAG: ABC transporter permease [Pseudomonadota bacterium]
MAEIALTPPEPEVIDELQRRNRFWPALVMAVRVVNAMVLREAITRFGTMRIGYLMAFIEPSLYFIGFIILRSFILDRVPFGESALLFLISGFITVRAFIAISRKMMYAIAANQALMTFPSVTPLAAVFARGAVETFTMCTIIFLFYAFIVWGADTARIEDPVEMTWAAMALFGLAFGIGCFNAVIGMLVQTYRIVYAMITLPLLITSGVFFVPTQLPPEYQEIIAWNPVLHCVEWFRVAIYMDYEPLLSKSYVVGFAVVSLGLGVIACQVFRVRLLD